MIQAIDAIRREVVVPVPVDEAFDIFTSRITDWWPSHHHIGSAPIERIVIEPHEGGRWYTRHQDGTETSTGHVVTWDPPERLVITWQVGADWRYHPELITTVDISFVAEDPDRTRVKLEHRDLERFGPEAEKMRATFEAPEAWTATLAAYAADASGA